MIESATEYTRQIFRDLRDRRMLIPAIALVVAIIAVPVIAGGGSTSVAVPVAPTAGSTPASMSGAAELDPVVLTDVPGLRDYHQRLERFGTRNPFKQQMVGGTGGGSSDATQSGGGGSGSSGNGASTSSSSSSTSTPTVEPSPTPTTDPTITGGTSSGGGSDQGSGGEKLIKITIDVRVGLLGKTKVLRDVKSLAFLPGDESPVVQYVEGDYGGTKASFVLSPDVTSTEGDGKCDPGRNNCQFLLLKTGDEQLFKYGPKAKVYRLELLAIHREKLDVTDPKGLGREAVKTSRAAVRFVAHLDQ